MTTRPLKRQRLKVVCHLEEDDVEEDARPAMDVDRGEAVYNNSRIPSRHVPITTFAPPAPSQSKSVSLQSSPSLDSPAPVPAPEKSNRWKPAAQFMKEFMARQPEILDVLYSREHHPRSNFNCACGQGPQLYRCVDCFDSSPSCASCFKVAHLRLPFHRVQIWQGAYFSRYSLKQLGFELCLGHGGERCPNAPSLARTLTVVHVNGVHSIPMVYCACAPLVQRATQLLSAGLYPATWKEPETAFTIEVLKHFHLESLQCRTTAHDYWAVLRRLTDNTRASPVPDRYEELLRVSREWRVLTRLKRSGQDLGINTIMPHLGTSVAVPCPACPAPGVNLPDNWQSLITPQNRHQYTLFLGMDGNYKANVKSKRHDPDDVPLLDGRGYFVDTDAFKQYQKALGGVEDPNEHKSTCVNLKTMRPLTKRRGLDVSGVIAVVCVRHSMYRPGAMADLEVGEPFSTMDYVAVGGIGKDADPALPRVMTNDKGCQWCINLVQRFTERFPDLLPVAEALKVLVPKLHLQGHKESCRYLFSLNYTPHCGRTDGEGVERPWDHSNETAKITREMNPGHRKDTYDDTNADWNYRKVVLMSAAIVTKLRAMYKSLLEAEIGFQALTEAMDPDIISQWEALPTEPTIEDGEVVSVYRGDRKKLPKYSELVAALLEAEQKAAPVGSRLFEKVYCATTFVDVGLDIEDQQVILRTFVAGLDTPPSRDQKRELCLRRAQLRDDITKFRSMQKIHMPALGDAPGIDDFDFHIEEEFGIPEDESLDLPSTWPSESRRSLGFSDLGAKEYVLRKGKADAALSRLRVAIQAYSAFGTFRRNNVSGQNQTTRAEQRLRSHENDIKRATAAYRRHWEALANLGLAESASDAQRFQKLSDVDVKSLRPNSLTSAKTGESVKEHAWFWAGDRDPDENATRSTRTMDELTREEQRVRWFRARANKDRFQEEVEILHAELDRTIATFKRMNAAWSSLSQENFDRQAEASLHTAGRGSYAAKQASIYAQWLAAAEKSRDEAQRLQSNHHKPASNVTHHRSGVQYAHEWSYYPGG